MESSSWGFCGARSSRLLPILSQLPSRLQPSPLRAGSTLSWDKAGQTSSPLNSRS